MRQFLWRWAWAFALLALGLSWVLHRWGGYWTMKHLSPPPPQLPHAAEVAEPPTEPPQEVPAVQGEISEDTRKALLKHQEAQKTARRPPH